jgi:DNA-binding transcriptional MerR regulator
MPLFGKKRPEGKGYIPVERVKDLTSKGFSEPEVIDILRSEGFSPEEIDKALTQALKFGVTEEKTLPEKPPEKKEEPKVPTYEEIAPPGELEVPETSLPPSTPAQPSPPLEMAYPEYTTEEYIEYVVGEKVSEVLEKVENVSKGQERLEKRLTELNERLSEISRVRVLEEERMKSWMDEMKSLVEEVKVGVGSLEKAFKETLPALVEAVRALSAIVKGIKKS